MVAPRDVSMKIEQLAVTNVREHVTVGRRKAHPGAGFSRPIAPAVPNGISSRRYSICTPRR